MKKNMILNMSIRKSDRPIRLLKAFLYDMTLSMLQEKGYIATTFLLYQMFQL